MPKLNKEDYIGKQYGRLTVRDIVYKQYGSRQYSCFVCECECGNMTTAVASRIKNGDTQSCGCLHKEIMASLMRTHGQKRTRLYSIWKSMRNRCHNPHDRYYRNYGGRGITVYEEWRSSFEAFRDWALANGYADNLTIERIGNDEGYMPGNCRWATYIEQSRNKRLSSNNTSGIKGVTFDKRVGKWAAAISVNKQHIALGRFNTIEQAAEARRKAELEYW